MSSNINVEDVFFAQLNDIQSLKKQKYLNSLRSKKNVDLIIDIVNNQIENFNPVFSEDIVDLSKVMKKSINGPISENYYSILNSYHENQIQIIKYTDDKYPQKLLKIKNPPFFLYCKGDIQLLNKKSIAIVGTRDISDSGIDTINDIVADFVKANYVIVSGLAKGTDTFVHTSTISSDGNTIAVLPGSIKKVIPNANKNLVEDIVNKGLVLSEITENVSVHKGRFIERNRITSGLSEAVIVIETGEKGGSIRQAETAIKQGKPVFIIIPDVNNIDKCQGYKKLISMGAVGVNSADQIINTLESNFYSNKRETKVTTFADF